MTRVLLPDRRAHELMDVQFTPPGSLNPQRFIVGVGRDEAGEVREIFITGGKVGSGVEAAARDAAILTSIALQTGVPLASLQSAMTREIDDAPSSVIGAVLDAIAGGTP